MDDARVPALRTARLICAMEQSAIRYKRAGDEAGRAEAYALWCEALRDLAADSQGVDLATKTAIIRPEVRMARAASAA